MKWKSPLEVTPECYKVMCAVCDKPVDRTFEEDDKFNDVINFKVYCHGMTDRCTVEKSFFVRHRPILSIEATAFKDQKKQIEAAS